MPVVSSLTRWVGIDPGQSGGISVITGGASLPTCLPMPESERDIWDVVQRMTETDYSTSLKIHCVIERVHAMPKQGVSSSFKFGQGYGSLRMALIAAGISFDDVPPQTWMKAMVVKSVKDSTKAQQKEKLRAYAQQLFPALPIWKEPKSKGRQLAVADSLLIAEYCRRLHLGKL